VNCPLWQLQARLGITNTFVALTALRCRSPWGPVPSPDRIEHPTPLCPLPHHPGPGLSFRVAGRLYSAARRREEARSDNPCRRVFGDRRRSRALAGKRGILGGMQKSDRSMMDDESWVLYAVALVTFTLLNLHLASRTVSMLYCGGPFVSNVLVRGYYGHSSQNKAETGDGGGGGADSGHVQLITRTGFPSLHVVALSTLFNLFSDSGEARVDEIMMSRAQPEKMSSSPSFPTRRRA